MLNAEQLALTGRGRLEALVNAKRARFMFITDQDEGDEYGLKPNATLIDLQQINTTSKDNTRAIFRIDWEAQGVPSGFRKPKRRYHHLGLNSRRITAEEIISEFGINGTLYLIAGTRPAFTTDLAALISDTFNLKVTEADIVKEVIPNDPLVTCVMVKFHPNSVGYVGAMRVDIAVA